MKPARWPGAKIHTVRERRLVARRLDRRNLKVEETIADMASGASLHLHFDWRRGAVWTLSDDGSQVDDEIARLVIQHLDVAAVGDILFAGTPSQTYRYIGD
jgi:hypothetical protein